MGPDDDPRAMRPPRYRPRSESQAIAWKVTILAIAFASFIWLVPTLFDGDETGAREALVIVILGLIAVWFAIYVVDRLRIQAGEAIAPRVVFPWRTGLERDELQRLIGSSGTRAEPRLRLPEVDLRDANLRRVDLGQADLSEASLRNADLSAATLLGADLTGADLRGADLSQGNLVGTTLAGASLEGAQLVQATLAGADLRSADLRSTDLRDVFLQGARYDDRTRWPADFSPADAGAERVERGD